MMEDHGRFVSYNKKERIGFAKASAGLLAAGGGVCFTPLAPAAPFILVAGVVCGLVAATGMAGERRGGR